MQFTIGDKVEWAGEKYTVWSMHEKNGWRWIVREGTSKLVAAKVSSLRLLEASPSTGLQRKEQGMAQALTATGITAWKSAFRSTIEEFEYGRRFTSEDVLAIVGLPTGEVAKDANNAVGAMINGMARKGVIHKTPFRVQSRRSSSHGAELIVWERS